MNKEKKEKTTELIINIPSYWKDKYNGQHYFVIDKGYRKDWWYAYRVTRQEISQHDMTIERSRFDGFKQITEKEFLLFAKKASQAAFKYIQDKVLKSQQKGQGDE